MLGAAPRVVCPILLTLRLASRVREPLAVRGELPLSRQLCLVNITSLNFNDLLGGIVTLFVCTVGNNYNSIVIAYVRATGSKVC